MLFQSFVPLPERGFEWVFRKGRGFFRENKTGEIPAINNRFGMKYFVFIVALLVNASFLKAQDSSWPDVRSFLKTDRRIEVKGYDSHVEIRFLPDKKADRYAVYRRDASGGETLRGETSNFYYLDFMDDPSQRNASYSYRVVALDKNGKKVGQTPQATASVRDFSDDELLEMTQEYTFRYFWDFADPFSGLALERSNEKSRPNCVTTGGTGFGVMAMISGVENGFITRRQAVDRLLKITGWLEQAPRFHGAWAHWYNSQTKKAYHFSEKDNGGDLVETAFLIQGLLAVKGYFDGNDPDEKALSERIEKLWREVDWNHYTQGQEVLYWHWSPDFGFAMNHPVKGYDETFVTYVLAASSPTFPISPGVYHNGWVNHKPGEFFCLTDFYGIMLPLGKKMQLGGPLFWVHYSYTGLCPKGLRDRYADYWEQNRRYTLVNRAWCIDNPYGYKGYGEDFWGLTASDALPSGYRAHAPGIGSDTGTVAPTAALSSMPYTPEESLSVLKNLYRNLGKDTFGPFGFYDAVSLETEKTHTGSYLAIDQGPIVVMIENYRSGAVWNAFMKNKDVRRGLDRLGFTIDGERP